LLENVICAPRTHCRKTSLGHCIMLTGRISSHGLGHNDCEV
jgi:hypothetical protein